MADRLLSEVFRSHLNDVMDLAQGKHNGSCIRLTPRPRCRASLRCWQIRSGPRIQSGTNIYDQAAAPLKPGLPGRRGYSDYKAVRGLQSLREWT
jgi:hypothetical protein